MLSRVRTQSLGTGLAVASSSAEGVASGAASSSSNAGTPAPSTPGPYLTSDLRLKLRFANNEIRRLSLPPPEVNFETLVAKVAQFEPGPGEYHYIFKYHDGNDLVTIANTQDLQEAVHVVQQQQQLLGAHRAPGDAAPAACTLELYVRAVSARRGGDPTTLPPSYEAIAGGHAPAAAEAARNSIVNGYGGGGAGGGAGGTAWNQESPLSALDPLLQVFSIFRAELVPAARRAWATCQLRGLATVDDWTHRLHQYTVAQRVVFVAGAALFVGLPLTVLVKSAFSVLFKFLSAVPYVAVLASAAIFLPRFMSSL